MTVVGFIKNWGLYPAIAFYLFMGYLVLGSSLFAWFRFVVWREKKDAEIRSNKTKTDSVLEKHI